MNTGDERIIPVIELNDYIILASRTSEFNIYTAIKSG
jgi:hypothetical protein